MAKSRKDKERETWRRRNPGRYHPRYNPKPWTGYLREMERAIEREEFWRAIFKEIHNEISRIQDKAHQKK